jgi:hypothetical protein
MFERDLASDALDHSDGLRVATFHLKAVHKKTSDILDRRCDAMGLNSKQ